jgi:hydroxyacylglutathione hydrolase
MQAQLIEEYSGSGYHIYQFKTGELSALSYLVESAGNALLIDPIIDGSAYTAQLKKTGAELKYVLLTHFHADIILGHLEYKVPVVMGQGSKVPQVSFPVEEFKDGAVLNLGDVKITVLSTPGPSL